jgi:predicted AAA+ superfamily ATPase
MEDLKELKIKLSALAVFRKLLHDRVVTALMEFLERPDAAAYAEFVACLYEANGGDLAAYIEEICLNDENVYVQLIGRGETPPKHIEACVQAELETLQSVAALEPAALCAQLPVQGFLPEFISKKVNLPQSFTHRVQNIGKYGYGLYAKNRMFYLDENGHIVPVKSPDRIALSDFVDYEAQRKIIIDNTKALLAGRPAANILLTGDAGTGKSSTIKAVGNELFSEGLRIIEIRKDQLQAIPKILDELAANPLKFVLFIDDLSFLKDDDNFNALKAVLEGSVSAKSKNVVIYATSNRRHIIKENFSDREGDDIHRNDTMQEIVSLSERFGIHITFSKPDKDTYLRIVRYLADQNGISIPEEELQLKAERFALERGGRSARLARQFIDGLLSVSL